jgi:BirA family biotin operon repressor/biotin-[acetyl-CoA-carboxylase] ligase
VSVTAPPDPVALDPVALDPVTLAARLGRSRWSPIRVVQTTGSTITDLVAGWRAGELGAGAVELADLQTGGRGRLDRRWSAPAGSSLLLAAVVVPPDGRPWTMLPLLTGVAVARAVARMGGGARLKWPNDVLLDGRKCCGILVETTTSPAGPAAVVGLGLNLSQSAAELPGPQATSLALAGLATSREAAAEAVLRALDEVLGQWEAGADPVGLYRPWCATLGRMVRLELGPGRSVQGLAGDIAPDGRLGLDLAGGRQWFAAGDVHHLRPTD